MTLQISDEQSIVLAAGAGLLAALLYGLWLAGQPLQPAPVSSSRAGTAAPAAINGPVEAYEA